MKNIEFSEIFRWYEKQLGRKITEEEKIIVRHQCVMNNHQTQRTKNVEKYGISLCGIRYEENFCDRREE